MKDDTVELMEIGDAGEDSQGVLFAPIEKVTKQGSSAEKASEIRMSILANLKDRGILRPEHSEVAALRRRKPE